MIGLSFFDHGRSPRPSILLNTYLLLTFLFDIARSNVLAVFLHEARGSIYFHLHGVVRYQSCHRGVGGSTKIQMGQMGLERTQPGKDKWYLQSRCLLLAEPSLPRKVSTCFKNTRPISP
ncbi:hypothetical protein F5X96DRAFT_656346, partial [Biscogniauxia mediterranea]